MKRVRRDFYKGKPDKTWFAQQAMVKKALLYPARWLHEKAVEIPAARYEAILTDILDTAARHGDLSKVTYMSRYLLFCVQEHMSHHGDKYYREGVSIRNVVGLLMSTVDKVKRGADGTVPAFAQADSVLQVGKRKAKVKPAAAAEQPSLF